MPLKIEKKEEKKHTKNPVMTHIGVWVQTRTNKHLLMIEPRGHFEVVTHKITD